MSAIADYRDCQRLDASGCLCPEPVMLLHRQMRELEVGAVVELSATDPSTERDIPKFCHYLRHSLLASERRGELYLYWVRKEH